MNEDLKPFDRSCSHFVAIESTFFEPKPLGKSIEQSKCQDRGSNSAIKVSAPLHLGFAIGKKEREKNN